MTAGSTSPTPRTATTSSTCRWPIRPACRAPAASPSSRSTRIPREAMSAYMRALKPGGILSVTLWNKEEPPKSVLKLYATMVAAARDVEGADVAKDFYVASSYLSTATVLYKRGGFTPGRDRQAQRPYQGDVVRRDLLSRLQGRHGRAEADPAGLPRPVLLRGHAGRSDGAVGEGAQRQAAARHDHDRRRHQDRRQGRGAPPVRACRPPCSAGSPGTT